jgi:pSer/pThr/pTyr-binding forkhead associated (FHA) protein
LNRYPLSELVKKVAQAGTFDAFVAQAQCDWLVWDTTSWKPTRRRAEPTQATGHVAVQASGAPPMLFITLELTEGATRCVLGRSVDCDVSLNEATLSGHHLAFTRSAAGVWQVEDLGSSNGSTLAGNPLTKGPAQPLQDGTVITAGDVHLTFRTSRSVFEMLNKAP